MGHMLSARRQGVRRTRYRIDADRKRLTTWTPLVKGEGGTFVLDGVEYLVDAGGTATHAVLSVADGGPVAVADGVGQTPWFVRTDRAVYRFERTLARWSEQLMLAGRRPVGAVRRTGRRGRYVEAELPGLPAPVAVFVLAVVITMWADAGGCGELIA